MPLRPLRFLLIVLFLISVVFVPATLFCKDTASDNSNLSENNARDIIDRVYLDVLQRYPDEGGLRTYTNFLVKEEKSEEWLRQVLLNSEEGQKVSRQKQKKTYILFFVSAFPLLFIGFAFYFRKNTRDFILNSLLVLFSIFIACLFLEIALRTTAAYKDHKNTNFWRNLDSSRAPKKNAAVFLRDIIQLSANPHLVYELMPNLFVRFMGGKVTTDENGFRITPGSCEQPEAYTILGLGDSVMFGWGVNDQETYFSHLTRYMPESCIRIINTAVPGYNTVMEVEALEEKGLAFHPDLVVIHFVDNDLYLPSFIRTKDKHITLTRSYLLAALSRWRGTKIRTRPFDNLVRISGDVPEEYQYMVGVDAYHQAMKRLVELSREHNFRILLLSNWTVPDYVNDITTKFKIPTVELGKPLQQYCREHEINEYQGSVLTISKTDPHYSDLAHRIVANEVYQNLLQDTSIAKRLKYSAK